MILAVWQRLATGHRREVTTRRGPSHAQRLERDIIIIIMSLSQTRTRS